MRLGITRVATRGPVRTTRRILVGLVGGHLVAGLNENVTESGPRNGDGRAEVVLHLHIIGLLYYQ